MVKIQGVQAEKFAVTDQPGFHAVLFYGPDEGRVRERARSLARCITGGVDDPFQSVVLSADQVDDTPGLLSDEALQLSLMGGRRVVTLDGAVDAHAAQVKSLLAQALPLPALLILIAGELTPRSKLRVLFDKEKTLASVATYADDSRSLADTVRDWTREVNRQMSREAEALLVQNLGGDRSLTRQELQKLEIYMLSEPAEARIETAHVEACLAGLTQVDQDDALFAALAGDTKGALSRLGEAFENGKAPEALVASVLFHLTKLSDGQSHMNQGVDARGAVDKMRPPVFFTKKAAVAGQLQRLGRGDLLMRIYMNALELQRQVRLQRDQAPLFLERFLMSVAGACSRLR